MRENLENEGGAIMAEAAMMAIAEVIGRGAAHSTVYDAVAIARADRITLSEALERTLDEHVLEKLPALGRGLDPMTYLGETDEIVTAALDAWARVTAESPAAGTARR
jgi:3-carboxy-cis,cis-muconate cycloisomerase